MFWKAICSLCGVLFGLAAAAVAQPEEGEFRALWVDAWGRGLLDEEQVQRLVEDARANHFNALIVQVRRRGDAFYLPGSGNPDPRTVALAPDFDPLATLISAARDGHPRIEVHAWVTANLVWSDRQNSPEQADHVFNRRPDFLTENEAGEQFFAEGYYLDPGHPEAMREVRAVAIDLVKNYPVDGLHWDFLRYPHQDSGYNPVALARYRAEFGFPADYRPAPGDPQFSAWRRRQLTDFIRWAHADLLQVQPDLVLSAAVFSRREDAYSRLFQDWAAWLSGGLIDAVMPMVYTSRRGAFDFRTMVAMRHQAGRHVYPGIGAFQNTRAHSIRQLNHVRSEGFPGYSLFSYRAPARGTRDDPSALGDFREHFQPEWRETPALPWKSDAGIVMGRVIDGRTGSVVYNAHVTLTRESSVSQLSCVHGGHAFYGVAGGAWRVSARAGDLTAIRAVNVFPGRVAQVDLVLQPRHDSGGSPKEEPITLADFEEAAVDGRNGVVLFRHPYHSGATLENLELAPNAARVTATPPPGAAGRRALKIEFAFKPFRDNPWLRLTTHQTAVLPNPIIPLDRSLQFDIHANQPIYVALGVRDNSAFGLIGTDGGERGPIEWVGGSTDNTRNGPPLGRLVPAGEWVTVTFDLPREPVKGFTGKGSLISAKGVLEHLALVPVIHPDGSYSTQPFEIYLDNFAVTTAAPEPPVTLAMTVPGERAGLTFAAWAGEFLPEGQRGRTDDPGGFGIPNLLRYALGLDPANPRSTGLPHLGSVEVDVAGNLEERLALTYTRRLDAVDLHYWVEASVDLVEWAPIAGTEEILETDGTIETVRVIDTAGLHSSARRFLRLRVE